MCIHGVSRDFIDCAKDRPRGCGDVITAFWQCSMNIESLAPQRQLEGSARPAPRRGIVTRERRFHGEIDVTLLEILVCSRIDPADKGNCDDNCPAEWLGGAGTSGLLLSTVFRRQFFRSRTQSAMQTNQVCFEATRLQAQLV